MKNIFLNIFLFTLNFEYFISNSLGIQNIFISMLKKIKTKNSIQSKLNFTSKFHH